MASIDRHTITLVMKMLNLESNLNVIDYTKISDNEVDLNCVYNDVPTKQAYSCEINLFKGFIDGHLEVTFKYQNKDVFMVDIEKRLPIARQILIIANMAVLYLIQYNLLK